MLVRAMMERSKYRATAGTIIDLLLVHQDKMLLNCKVNELLQQKPFGWHDFQFTICEVRGFVYSPVNTRRVAGFMELIKKAHFAWHLSEALLYCWETTAIKENAEDSAPEQVKN